MRDSCTGDGTRLGPGKGKNPDVQGQRRCPNPALQGQHSGIPAHPPAPHRNGLRNPFKEVECNTQARNPEPGGQGLEPTSRLASVFPTTPKWPWALSLFTHMETTQGILLA